MKKMKDPVQEVPKCQIGVLRKQDLNFSKRFLNQFSVLIEVSMTRMCFLVCPEYVMRVLPLLDEFS